MGLSAQAPLLSPSSALGREVRAAEEAYVSLDRKRLPRPPWQFIPQPSTGDLRAFDLAQPDDLSVAVDFPSRPIGRHVQREMAREVDDLEAVAMLNFF